MNLQSIWRAIVEPPKNAPGDYAERIVFVEACSAKSATAKIIAIIASIDGIADDEVSFYNLDSWADLVAKGVSSNWDHRIFETGWRGVVIDGWASCPLFFVTNPEPLRALWMAATTVGGMKSANSIEEDQGNQHCTGPQSYGPDNPPRLRKAGESLDHYRKAMGWVGTIPSKPLEDETCA